MPDTLTADPYSAPDWWLDVPSVDGVPDALERDFQIDDDGRAFLEHLSAELEKRAAERDVQTFIATLTRQRKPACVRVKWRGVIVCAHSVPKLDAWAKATGATLLWPLAGCGSYQTSTKASAGTHAGGGAIDINGNGMTPAVRAMVARAGREVGLQVDWFRGYIAGLWTNHFHAIDPDCPQLASVAAAQCVECFAGGDGLVGTKPDPGWRGNIPELRTVFDNRLYLAVADIGSGVEQVAQLVADTTKVKTLQRFISQPQTGVWDEDTDIDLRNIRAVALERYTGAYFRRWTRAQRERMQLSVGAGQDGAWGPQTAAKFRAATVFIQRVLGVTQDSAWGPVTDKAFLALQARRRVRLYFTRPVGAFPTPGKAGSLYGPSTAGKAWYSGAAAGVLTRDQVRWQIKRIQRMVGANVDGIYGAATASKVRAWQKGHRLTVDGLTGRATWSAMAKANRT